MQAFSSGPSQRLWQPKGTLLGSLRRQRASRFTGFKCLLRHYGGEAVRGFLHG